MCTRYRSQRGLTLLLHGSTRSTRDWYVATQDSAEWNRRVNSVRPLKFQREARLASPTPSQLPRLPPLALTASTIEPSSSLQPSTEVAETHGPSSQTDQDTETPTPPGTPPRSRVHGATPGLEGHRPRVETDAFYTVMVVWDQVPFPYTDAIAERPERVGSRPAAGVRFF